MVIGGDDARAIDAVAAAVLRASTHRSSCTDVASAETIKYASNAFLSTKISFINEIANLCDAVGADVDAVASGIGLDTRIGPAFLNAGIGYGGSCFPKDTRALDFIATMNGYQFDLLKAVIDVNNRQRLLPLIHLDARAPRPADDRKVAILGLSFKPMTDDVRESPALDIIPLLRRGGRRGRRRTTRSPPPVDLGGADALRRRVGGARRRLGRRARSPSGRSSSSSTGRASARSWPGRESSSTAATRSMPTAVEAAG